MTTITAENSDSRTTKILDSGHSSGTISSIIPFRQIICSIECDRLHGPFNVTCLPMFYIIPLQRMRTANDCSRTRAYAPSRKSLFLNNNERQQLLFSWQFSYHVTQHPNIVAWKYLDSYLKKSQMEMFQHCDRRCRYLRVQVMEGKNALPSLQKRRK